MTQIEATELTTKLLGCFGKRGFDVSLPDKESYDLVALALEKLGRSKMPDGEFFIVHVLPD